MRRTIWWRGTKKSFSSKINITFLFQPIFITVEDKDINQLGVYLDLCGEREFLLSAVWLSFKYKEKHPEWNVNQCFEQSIWDVMVSEAKRETKLDLKSTVDKINQIQNLCAV